MSGSGGKFREDQVLVICPGSQTTMAQMGVGELSPPTHRFPTRMFPDPENPGNYLPNHTYKCRKPSQAGSETINDAGEDEYEWVEDPDSSEGAVYPIICEFLCLPGRVPCRGRDILWR